MNKIVMTLLMLLVALSVAQEKIQFDDYFINQALRIDLYQFGDAREEFATIDQMYREAIWPGNPNHLIDPFNNGSYEVKVYDIASNKLIYSHGFSCIFAEYRTTTPAIEGVKRVYERSVRIPYPKRPVLFVVESRDKKNMLHAIFTQKIDPSDYHIIRETTLPHDIIYPALQNGDPHTCVDLVFIGEGYGVDEKEKFKGDCDRYVEVLFGVEPFKSHKDKFNVTGVLRPSPENGMDEPRQQRYKKTTLNASFNALDTDRYLLTEENKLMRAIASQVPYDAIIILANSERYGGGGIYNDYAISTVDNERSNMVFPHEFGHSFAGLADEYYSSDVAYNDIYPKGVEPLEPNITAYLSPGQVKWQHLLSPGIQIPTEYGKDALDSLQLMKRKIRQEERKELEAAAAKKASDKKRDAIKKKFRSQMKAVDDNIEAIREQYTDVYDKVGLFEGAGYSAKGLYRPMVYCLMIYHPENEFCLVCQEAIKRMIDFYSE
ncbi:hypothetical protein JXO59_13095 [candidate division KSB1 bacterium]|nr:hypothetical protein [candidate division KSB1 bacterium]